MSEDTRSTITIDDVVASFAGTLAVCAVRLGTRRTNVGAVGADGPFAGAPSVEEPPAFALRADEQFPAASLVKIPIALEAFAQIADGALDPNERLRIGDAEPVIGSGVLRELDGDVALPLRDLLYLAIAISDNVASNLVLARVGRERVNARLAALGLATTRVRGTILTRDGAAGERAPTTAHEVAKLLVAIHERRAAPPDACDALLALLAKTQTASAIGRGLPVARFDDPPAVRLAYKTGSIVGVVNEAGIVTRARGAEDAVAYALVLLSQGSRDVRPTFDNVARVAIGEISRRVYEALNTG